MVHELQHAIQAREMWPHGSARTEFVRKLYPTSVTEKWRDPKTGEKLSAEQLYYRTFGEAEARNADARRDMTPEERKQPGKRPWETLDRDPKTGEKLEEGDLRTREQFGLPPHNVFTSGPDKVLPPTHRLALGREASASEGGGITSLPGGARTLKPLEEVSQSTLKRRLKNKKQELSDIIGMPIKRDITLRHQKKINKILEGADDLTTARINKLADDIYVLKERISPETRFGPSYRTHPDMTRWPLPEGQTSSENTIVGIMGELNLTEAIGPVKRRSGVIGQGTEGIMQRLWEMSPQDVKMTNAILKQKFNRGILEFEFPQDPDPNMLRVTTDHYGTPSDVKQRIESILEPSPQGPRIVKATGGFIDKPLYERTLYA
jgi:hypothetical protein